MLLQEIYNEIKAQVLAQQIAYTLWFIKKLDPSNCLNNLNSFEENIK